MAAGVRVTQREQKPKAGREAARQGGEEQPNLSPKASEDEALETDDCERAALSPQPFPREQHRGAAGPAFLIGCLG